MKVIIAGSRAFHNYEELCTVCNHILSRQTVIEIVSGTARGADALGEQYAIDKGFQLTKFPANWNKYGKSAGYKRNEEMAIYADALIALWDAKSSGTKHMIDLAKRHQLKIHYF